MDDQRFDSLTKSLARGTSRRQLLKGLAGAVLGAGALLGGAQAGSAVICRQPGVLCAKDAQCCSGSCVNNHCDCPDGSPVCGRQCCAAGQICQSGQCVTPCTPTTCAAQGVTCGTISDGCNGTLICGDCPSATCSAGNCVQGHCTLTPIVGCCTADSQCDDRNACTVDTCTGNTCLHTPLACQPQDACHTASCDPAQGCVQTAGNDGASCGTGGQICQQGTCACPIGTIDCGGTCQQCCSPADCPGTTCSPATCTNGTCGRAPIASCCTQDTDCGDSNACTTDTCVSNTCQHTPVSCQPSDACHTASCDPSQGCVESLVSDGTSCGTNQVCCQGTCCAAGQTCQSGACATACTPNCTGKSCGDDGCGGSCGSCDANHTCTNGQCSAKSCTSDAECSATGPCQTAFCVISPKAFIGYCSTQPTPDCCTATANNCQAQNNCDVVTCDTATNTCVHTSKSCPGCFACNLNDGSCTFDTCAAANPCQQCDGTQCVANTSLNYATYPCTGAKAGEFCYNGQCVACLPTGDDCTNNTQCCTDACQPDIQLNGNYVCTCSPDGIGTCSSNVNCCNNCCNSAGFCADFSEDLDNCGACGVQVPAGGICDNGNPTCTAGFHNDNGRCCAVGESSCGSYCANLSSDLLNCGSCGFHCDVGHPVCAGGYCCTIIGTDCY